MTRLVIIDGHAILHRAYHALPPLTTSKGQVVNAVYGFTSMLLRVINDLKPTHLAVAFDRPEPTFRNKIFKDYQIQRPKADEEFISQIDLVKKIVDMMGIPVFEKAGYEADDVIGTIAKQAVQSSVFGSQLSDSGQSVNQFVGKQNRKTKKPKNQNLKPDNRKPITEIIIVTGDRDMLQLVSDGIKVYMPIKGLSESKLYGEKDVEEKFGVSPSQIVDYKALVGDASDNYPGVAGVGPKTASQLLQNFKTLEQIYRKVDKVESDKVCKALEENKESAEMAKKLATIVCNVPIKIDIEKCKLPNLDRPDIHKLFEEFEFRSLIPRLSARNIEHRTYNIERITKNKEQDSTRKNNKIQQTSLF